MNSIRMIDPPKVAVLLSTYNGENYVSALLDSLLSQSYEAFTIIIRDDGSSDGTIEILRRYERKFTKIRVEIGTNLGVVGSFLELLKAVDADVYMFCDQDDVWLSGKISTAVEILVDNGLDRNILFHSDLVVVDKNLEMISPSFMRQQGLSLPNAHFLEVLVIQNCVVGCTVAITKSLAQLMMRSLPCPNLIAMHDWWLALLARTHGQIVFSPTAEILYRQHEFNVSGARKSPFWSRIFVQFSFAGLQRINNYRVRVADQAIAFIKMYGKDLSDRSIKIFMKAINLHPKRGPLAVAVALMSGVRFSNFYMNLALFYTSVVTWLFKIGRSKN